jgi:hypothetical protein
VNTEACPSHLRRGREKREKDGGDDIICVYGNVTTKPLA